MSYLIGLSVIALWVLVIVLYISVFALYRHLGTVALTTRDKRNQQGPGRIEESHRFRLYDVDGVARQVGRGEKLFQFIFFGSVTCQPCKQALPFLFDFAKAQQDCVETLLVCRGDEEAVRAFIGNMANREVKVIADNSGEVTGGLAIHSTPFAMLISSEGEVLAKGSASTGKSFERFAERVHISNRPGEEVESLSHPH